MMNRGVMDQRLMTSLLFGALQKHHADEYVELADVDDLIDDMLDELEDDDGTKMINDFMAPLMAAYGRQDIETIKRQMRRRSGSGVVDEEESSPSSNGSPKGKKAVRAVDQPEEETG